MGLQTNYHTHLALCGHAVGTPKEYVEEAIKQGFHILGISDHGPIPRDFMSNPEYLDFALDLQMDEQIFYDVYLPECRKVKDLFRNQIEVFIGVEIEYLSGREGYFKKLLNDLDYLALGVHYFPSGNRLYNVYDAMNKKTIMEYADTVSSALDTGLYRFITHPDIYLMHYQENGHYLFDEVALKAAKIIIEAAIRNNVFLEINGGGPRKGYFIENQQIKYLYPRYDFWKVVETYPEAKVVIGADAHRPEQLNDEVIQKTIDFANEFKLNIVSTIRF